MRSIDLPSWLAKPVDLDLPPGHNLAERAAALRLLVSDHSLYRSHAVMSGLGLDMGDGVWIRARGMVG